MDCVISRGTPAGCWPRLPANKQGSIKSGGEPASAITWCSQLAADWSTYDPQEAPPLHRVLSADPTGGRLSQVPPRASYVACYGPPNYNPLWRPQQQEIQHLSDSLAWVDPNDPQYWGTVLPPPGTTSAEEKLQAEIAVLKMRAELAEATAAHLKESQVMFRPG